jgi:hypothetical protein
LARAALLGYESPTYRRFSARIVMAGALPHLRHQRAQHRDPQNLLCTRISTPMYFSDTCTEECSAMRRPRARSLDACGRPSTRTGQAHAAAADPQPTAAALPPLARVPATTRAHSSSSVRSISKRDICAQRSRRPRPAAVAPDLVHAWRCRPSSRTRSAPSPRTCAAPARSERHASRAVVEGE